MHCVILNFIVDFTFVKYLRDQMLYNSAVGSWTEGMSDEVVVLKRMRKVWSVLRGCFGLEQVEEENQGGI